MRLPWDVGRLPPVIRTGEFGVRFDIRDRDPAAVYEVDSSVEGGDWGPIWTSSDGAALTEATVSGAGSGRRTVEVITAAGHHMEWLRVKASATE